LLVGGLGLEQSLGTLPLVVRTELFQRLILLSARVDFGYSAM
jgi:hypothetical protein